MTENYFALSGILNDPELANLPAVTSSSESLNYAELCSRVDVTAAWLLSLRPQTVALHAENSIEWVVIDLACQSAGIRFIPLPDYFSHQQSLHCIADAAVDILISDNTDFVSSLDQADIIDDSSLSLKTWRLWPSDTSTKPILIPEKTQKITYTSGSTGSPKGVCLSTNQQWQVAQSLADAIAIDKPRHLCLLPLGTLLENAAGIYAPLLSGGNIILVDGKNRGIGGSSGLDLLQLVTCISEWQPNTLIVLPQLLTALIAACQMGWQAPESLRFVAVGGGKVAPELIQQADHCGIPVFEGYGLSECCSVVSLNTPSDNKPGTVGKPLPHCRVSIIYGEIHVEGASHLGYLGEPESWDNNSIATGDLGQFDEDGYLIVNGRKKNVLISSFGRNISPEWVESELMAKPLFSQCIVVGDARPYLSALLTTANGATDKDVDAWIQQVNSGLPDYARIEAWRIIDKQAWHGLFTANGRPRRDLISRHFSDTIDHFYSSPTTKTAEATNP